LSDTILAIDIGSTKICAIIAEISSMQEVLIQGHGIAKSQGVKKGVINNIELASKAIKKAITDAKRISGSNITSATVSISNSYAKSLNSTGIVNIPNKDISIKGIKRVMQTALYNANVPNEYEVIHVLPYNFRVDNQDYVEDPFGMNASRMEVDVNIIMTQKSNLSNLKKAVRSAGIEIDGIVLSGYASSIATIDDNDEKELGVGIIDLGGQTSNLVIHTGNSIRYNDFLGVGSNHITNDLSIALHTPLQIAEKVKLHYGNLVESSNEIIELPIIGDEENRNSVSLEIVHSVIFSRVEETLMILEKSLKKSNLKDKIGAGIILTGGMTKLKGIRELAQAIFSGMPVRVGYPKKINGLFSELKDPSFSTVAGLLLYKAGKHTQYEIDFQQELLHSKTVQEESLVDIKIGTSTHDKREVPSESKPSENKGKSNIPESNNTILFDRLPELGNDTQNKFKKLANWARQLF